MIFSDAQSCSLGILLDIPKSLAMQVLKRSVKKCAMRRETTQRMSCFVDNIWNSQGLCHASCRVCAGRFQISVFCLQ